MGHGGGTCTHVQALLGYTTANSYQTQCIKHLCSVHDLIRHYILLHLVNLNLLVNQILRAMSTITLFVNISKTVGEVNAICFMGDEQDCKDPISIFERPARRQLSTKICLVGKTCQRQNKEIFWKNWKKFFAWLMTLHVNSATLCSLRSTVYGCAKIFTHVSWIFENYTGVTGNGKCYIEVIYRLNKCCTRYCK